MASFGIKTVLCTFQFVCLPRPSSFRLGIQKKHSIYLCLLIPEPSRYSIRMCSNKMTLCHQALCHSLPGAYLEKCVAVNLNQDSLRICELIFPALSEPFFLWSWNHHLCSCYRVSFRITNLWVISNKIDWGEEKNMYSIPLHQALTKVENRILHYSFLPKRDFVRCISQTWIPSSTKTRI